jgi:hypothetical protein
VTRPAVLLVHDGRQFFVQIGPAASCFRDAIVQDTEMAALYFFLGGWAALIALAVLSQFSGRLAWRLQIYAVAVMGAAFMISAVLLLLSEPWFPPDDAPYPTGPQIAGLVLGAVALYILRVALIGFRGLK